jgi:hypothetical protein
MENTPLVPETVRDFRPRGRPFSVVQWEGNHPVMETPEPYRKPSSVHFVENEELSQTVENFESVDATRTQELVDLRGLLLWQNPAISGLVFILGGFLLCAVDFLLRGDHPVTLLSGKPCSLHRHLPEL